MYRTTLRIFKEFPPEHYKRALMLLSEHASRYAISTVVDGDTLVTVEVDTDRDMKRFSHVIATAYPEMYKPVKLWDNTQEGYNYDKACGLD